MGPMIFNVALLHFIASGGRKGVSKEEILEQNLSTGKTTIDYDLSTLIFQKDVIAKGGRYYIAVK
ncbi:hypothetical protein AB685_00485 [Bacillus sp. LL01]|uniref:hypothetical protein n=1 Tax=Bacillus sp. LL01 TaxID=1665556 RepID=UPI00064D6E81|nr:hypothetical protein [Bacillus sp. LL01]KMJ59402.1 hypothetical protein AB685_00485 [Bacillus sp. LL01]